MQLSLNGEEQSGQLLSHLLEKDMKKIAFVVQLPRNVSPGQRFRFEQYEQLLTDNGFSVDTYPFLDESTYRILYQEGHIPQKIIGVLKGFFRRLKFLLKAKKYDYILLQREMAPVGPPVFEWITSHLLKVKIVYDFDDAIWISNMPKQNKVAAAIKCFWKIKWICKWSQKVSVGNHYLGDYARKFNSQVVYNPTCVDMQRRYNRVSSLDHQPLVIGWTGSHSTIRYLTQIIDALQELEKQYEFRFLTICDRKPNLPLQSLDYLPWNAKTEIEDLCRMDIGVMPLVADEWSEGKCGFKLIQYLALGIPALASPVGVNKQIIDHGRNGYLCNTKEEWVEYLGVLLKEQKKRSHFGEHGRQKMMANYSVHSNAPTFLSLFQD